MTNNLKTTYLISRTPKNNELVYAIEGLENLASVHTISTKPERIIELDYFEKDDLNNVLKSLSKKYLFYEVNMKEKMLLSGNEAIALGAYEAGCHFASAYPGTPSTEIVETLIKKYGNIDSQWCTNEKVALEVGYGACLAGARTLVCMKQVGLNVAADPFFTISYTGVNGGLVIITADEPGVHSSQNEQDNRNYAAFSKIPMLEPSDSQEAKEMVKQAFNISEKFDTPVLIRMTTRICHTTGIVYGSPKEEHEIKKYEKDYRKRSMVPINAYQRHFAVEERLNNLRKFADQTPLNQIIYKSKDIGIITSGISFMHAQEAFPQHSILKLGLSYPLPYKQIMDFSKNVKKIYIIEENDDFLEMRIRAMLPEKDISGKDKLPIVGELTTGIIKKAFSREATDKDPEKPEILKRLPVFCPGCPHRGSFHLIKKYADVITGDIGCYGLAALPPLLSMDTIICMGASIGMAEGFSKIRPDQKVVGVIGDSTFYHTGINGLLDLHFNKGVNKIVIFDNSITAMTGHQPHPGSPIDKNGNIADPIDLEKLVSSIGLQVTTLDPLKLKESNEKLKEIMASEKSYVIIFRSPCALLPEVRNIKKKPFFIDHEKCIACGACLKLLCPAIESNGKGKKPIIREFMCVGCGLCSQVCPKNAIKQEV